MAANFKNLLKDGQDEAVSVNQRALVEKVSNDSSFNTSSHLADLALNECVIDPREVQWRTHGIQGAAAELGRVSHHPSLGSFAWS